MVFSQLMYTHDGLAGFFVFNSCLNLAQLNSRVIGTKTVFLTFSIYFHLSYATNYMTIHLFDLACLATAIVSVGSVGVSLRVVSIARHLFSLFYGLQRRYWTESEGINGNWDVRDIICQKIKEGRKEDGLD